MSRTIEGLSVRRVVLRNCAVFLSHEHTSRLIPSASSTVWSSSFFISVSSDGNPWATSSMTFFFAPQLPIFSVSLLLDGRSEKEMQ